MERFQRCFCVSRNGQVFIWRHIGPTVAGPDADEITNAWVTAMSLRCDRGDLRCPAGYDKIYPAVEVSEYTAMPQTHLSAAAGSSVIVTA